MAPLGTIRSRTTQRLPDGEQQAGLRVRQVYWSEGARARHHGGELRRSGDTAVVSLAQLPAASGLSCNRSHLLVMRKTSMGLKLLQPLLLLPVRFLPEGGLCPRASHTCAVPELLVLASPTRTAGTRVRRRRRKATRIAGHRQHVFVDGIQRSEWTRGTCSSGRSWRRCSTWRRGEARRRRVARLRAVIVDVLVAIGARTIGACAIEDALPDEKIYGASWDDPEPYYSALTGWRTTSRPSCPSSVLVGGCKSSAPWRRAAAKRRHSRRQSSSAAGSIWLVMQPEPSTRDEEDLNGVEAPPAASLTTCTFPA